VERALRPELVIGLDLEAGRVTRVIDSVPLVFDGDPYADLTDLGRLAVRSDFAPAVVSGELPDGTPYARTVWVLREGVETRGGYYLRNGERERRFRSATVRVHKRLSHRWMLRGYYMRQHGEWRIPPSSIIDPTEPPGGGNRDGDPLTYCPYIGFGSGRDNICLGSDWSYDLAGMVQVAPDRRWGFNVAFDLWGRQGYILPYYKVTLGVPKNASGVPTAAATARPDSYRYDDVHVVNLRLEKELRFGDWGATLGLDVFNVTNSATVLLRKLRLGTPQSDWVQEVVNPRVVRLGVRFTYR
jgi:hypothetical protein